ncbi:adenine phosphoribosyltransferase [Saccharicrinis sp. FJH54]|uniref:adenine phosphoribosyltransferase n=1 Tax=Saccharicrinis sp. FJH54 TaxID=3344665 RepID=UPI0035D400D8
MKIEQIKASIRDVYDFPKKGIVFKDLTTLFKDAKLFAATVDLFVDRYKDSGITKVVGVESRGYFLGPVIAYKLGAAFVPIRKPGKLPSDVFSEHYDLEYGTDKIEIHKDALSERDVVLLHDDLLATGGTMEAAIKLVNRFNPSGLYVSFIVELLTLKGIEKLNEKSDVFSLIQF